MASSAAAGSSQDSGKASLQESLIKKYGARLIARLQVTAALMATVEVTKLLPLPEEGGEMLEAFLNDHEKGRCRDEEGMRCAAYDLDLHVFVLTIKLGEDGKYLLGAPWVTAGNVGCRMRPGEVVSLWGYRVVENERVPPVLLLRLDGTANEPLPALVSDD